MKIGYFKSLTGIRGLAAFLIVIHHFLDGSFNSDYINAIVRELNVGVNIFFILSGFLIWHRYSKDFKLNKNWLRPYLIKRIARIYPIYFILTTIAVLLITITQNQSFREFITIYILNITFLKGLSSEYVYTGISQAWTLTVEELFYLSIPLIMFLNLRKKIPILWFGLLIPILGFLLYLLFKDINFHGFFNNLRYVRITTFFGRFIEFLAGILLAKYIASNSLPKHNKPYFTIFGGTLILISVLLIFPNLQSDSLAYSIQTIPGYLFAQLIFPIFVCSMFYGLISENSGFKNFLESRVVNLLGKSSFSLYLIHDCVMINIVLKTVDYDPIVSIVLSCILAVLLWRYIEKPMNRKIKRFI